MIFWGVAWLALAGPAPAAPKELHTPAKGTIVVATVPSDPAKPKAGAAFEISVGDCVKPKGAPKETPADCGVVVALKGGGSGRHRLEWTAHPGGIVAQDEHTLAIGDDADTAMALSWRNVQLKKGLFGIVVTQQTGSERTKRRHDLFLNVKGHMVHALEATEPRGPATYSSVSSVDLDNDTYGELVLINSKSPDEEQADEWVVQVFAWRADVKKIVETPSWRPTIQAGVVGMFNNLADARAFTKNKCLREFLVVDSKSATLLPDGVFAVAFLAPTHGEAELALEAANACDDSLVGSVKAVTPGLQIDE